MVILPDIKRIHVVGAGGIGLSAAAKLLLHQGRQLTGSDSAANEATVELAGMGMEVALGHRAENLPSDAQMLLYSDAVPEDNPERVEARRRGLLQMSYFDFLGELSRVRRTVAVSGTNGKSTTTALLGLMLADAGLDPTVVVGSKVDAFADRNLRLGGGELLVVEACEYRANMLKLSPQAIVLTNLEADHLDFYRDLDHIRQTFQTYLDRLQPESLAVVNADDPAVAGLRVPEAAERITYGIESPDADYRAVNLISGEGTQSFELIHRSQGSLGRFALGIPGRYNVMNALAALTTAIEFGASVESLRRTLGEFRGIWRRFQRVGDFNGAVVISDYGHTPIAVRGTAAAARDFFPGDRLILCFQPHHRNRTKKLFKEFVQALDVPDVLILAEVYDVAGREAAGDAEVSSMQLAEAVAEMDLRAGRSPRPVIFAPDPGSAEIELRRLLQPGDVAIIMGAGNIYKIAESLVGKGERA